MRIPRILASFSFRKGTFLAVLFMSPISCLGASILSLPAVCQKGVLKQESPYLKGQKVELWVLPGNPYYKCHTGYFTEYCWSPDGRYLSYVDTRENAKIFDFLKQEILMVPGDKPFWANQSNRAVFLSGKILYMFDASNLEELITINDDVPEGARMSDTDYKDEYVYLWGGADGLIRYRLKENAKKEICGGVEGNKVAPNPFHPVVSLKRTKSNSVFEPGAGGVSSSLDGREWTTMNPSIMRHHNGWLGNGEYFLLGDGVVRGRKWNEPYPGNLHILSATEMGDVNGLGFGGRWVVGGGNGGRRAITIADLRSGDGGVLLHPFSAVALGRGAGDQSGYYDSEPKGSPDGTKVTFGSTVDLRTISFAFVTADQSGTTVQVTSTEGFPESGVFARSGAKINGCGVGSYQSKTATSFEGVKLGEFDTEGHLLGKGDWITPWRPRLIPEEGFDPPKRSNSWSIDSAVKGSPLRYQRNLQLYVAVVRKPDPPWLRRTESSLELIPGENHWETRGYFIYLDGIRLNEEPAAPGKRFALNKEGVLTAVAVEWSGIESEQSTGLRISVPGDLVIHKDPPSDFSWMQIRWLVRGEPVDERTARDAPVAEKETVHLYDGVIARAKYRSGTIESSVDLNGEGIPIRHLFYDGDGILTRRELRSAEGTLEIQELFDRDGSITEQKVRFDEKGEPLMHWFYDQGEVVRLVSRVFEARAARQGPGTYEKRDLDWVKVE